jgi:WhiB family transcriptional regulator, redox-sensing transcriptional regulator
LSSDETLPNDCNALGRVSLTLQGVPMPGDWAAQAVCRGEDPEIFFAAYGDAKRFACTYCVRCPVIVECREYAIPYPALRGIWGGTDEKQRRAERCRRLRLAV